MDFVCIQSAMYYGLEAGFTRRNLTLLYYWWVPGQQIPPCGLSWGCKNFFIPFAVTVTNGQVNSMFSFTAVCKSFAECRVEESTCNSSQGEKRADSNSSLLCSAFSFEEVFILVRVCFGSAQKEFGLWVDECVTPCILAGSSTYHLRVNSSCKLSAWL